MMIFSKNNPLIRAFKKGDLPIDKHVPPYTFFSFYYDSIMEDTEYPKWIAYLLKARARFFPQASSFADLACGTGNTLIPLLSKGYDLIGVDASASMIEKCYNKMKTHHLTSKVILGDLTSFQLPKPVNIMYSFNDSLNYLITEKELTEVFSEVLHQLTPQGFFLFDLSSEYNIYSNFSDPIYEHHSNFAFKWINDYNPSTYMLKSDLYFLDFQTETVYHEEHHQRIHPLDEVLSCAKEAGFPYIHGFNGFTFMKPRPRSVVYHVILRTHP